MDFVNELDVSSIFLLLKHRQDKQVSTKRRKNSPRIVPAILSPVHPDFVSSVFFSGFCYYLQIYLLLFQKDKYI